MYELTKVTQVELEGILGTDRKGAAKYPFAKMEVGDQFEVPLTALARVKSAARAHAARHQWRFVFKRGPAALRIIRVV